MNVVRPLDIHLINPLAHLPLGAFVGRDMNVPEIRGNLAFRNLMRARMVGLATGQEVAAHLTKWVPDVRALTPKEIFGS